jgi:diguanylate cyclase (GGDEF)-like protein
MNRRPPPTPSTGVRPTDHPSARGAGAPERRDVSHAPHPPHAPTSTPTSASAPDRTAQTTSTSTIMRVVCIGQSGLEHLLRRLPGVEVVRVRSALAAIGELSEPVDDDAPAHDQPPGPPQGHQARHIDRQVALVSDQGEPQGELLGAFLRAAREADPRVRLIRVGRRPDEPGYDAWIPAEIDAEGLSKALTGQLGAPAVAPVQGTAAPEREPDDDQEVGADAPGREGEGAFDRMVRFDVDPSQSASREELPADAGDDGPLLALLGGHDPLAAAMESVRARLGPEAVFIASPPGVVPTLSPGEDAAIVQHRSRVFGRLLCPGAEAGALRAGARRLALWLALDLQQRDLQRAALVDELTGAYNRRYFRRFLATGIEQCRAQRRTLSLLLMDIDDFKRYNDLHGHAVGDSVLVEAVRMLKTAVRSGPAGGDKVCRVGGDELAVIFYDPLGPRTPGSQPPSAVRPLVERFQRLVAAHRFPMLGERSPGPLSVSGGLATFPWDALTPDALIRVADERLMQSKREGKDRVNFGPEA